MAERRSVIVGTGSCLPEREVTNAELSTRVDTSDDWIVERTGIRSRRIAAEGETTSTLATVAARHALEAAGVEAGQLGLIIVATATPDYTFPSVATQVQAALGIHHCVAFDVQAVCSAFPLVLMVPRSLMTGRLAATGLA